MNTNVQVFQETEGLNPEQEVGCEEFVNCLVHVLNTRTTASSSHKVVCPEAAGILQCTPNVGCSVFWEIFDLGERNIIFQLADVLLQPFLHHIETQKRNLPVV